MIALEKMGLPQAFMNRNANLESFKANYKPMNFDIRNQDDVAVIDIDGFIGRDLFIEIVTGEKSPNTVESLKEQLRNIRANKIIVNINSPGGSFNDGLVIMDLLRTKKAEVVTNLYGLSASAATVIWQGGDRRRMSKNAFPLIHKVMAGMMGYFNSGSLLSMAEELETLDNRLVDIYHERTQADRDAILELMNAGEGYGKFIDAEAALEFGLADEIFDPADEEDPDVDRMNYALLDTLIMQDALKNLIENSQEQYEAQESPGEPASYEEVLKLMKMKSQD